MTHLFTAHVVENSCCCYHVFVRVISHSLTPCFLRPSYLPHFSSSIPPISPTSLPPSLLSLLFPVDFLYPYFLTFLYSSCTGTLDCSSRLITCSLYSLYIRYWNGRKTRQRQNLHICLRLGLRYWYWQRRKRRCKCSPKQHRAHCILPVASKVLWHCVASERHASNRNILRAWETRSLLSIRAD